MGRRSSVSGFEVAPVYRPADLEGLDPAEALGEPGEFPFTRGIHPTMYRGRPWTVRQYAGFSSATESNRRYRYLLEQGTTGLSVAFDLPTQMGYDSDESIAAGEVGKVGVPIDTVEDMKALFDGIPLGDVSTSMTINAPASLLLLMYEIAAEEQGVAPERLRGTIQNDVLKEYIARGTYIFPPAPSLRLVADTFAYCADRLPGFNTISTPDGWSLTSTGMLVAVVPEPASLLLALSGLTLAGGYLRRNRRLAAVWPRRCNTPAGWRCCCRAAFPRANS